MSSCLFTVRLSAILEATTETLESWLPEWKDKATNYDPDNAFERDRASGFKTNVLNAESELFCRKLGYSHEDVEFMWKREGGYFNPAVKMAMAQYMANGSATLKLENGEFALVND